MKDHAPALIEQFATGLKIATLECSCSYYWELYPFDRVLIEMYLDNSEGPENANRSDALRICFKYWKDAAPHRLLAGKGEQTIAFLYSRAPDTWERGQLPEALKAALIPYGLSDI